MLLLLLLFSRKSIWAKNFKFYRNVGFAISTCRTSHCWVCDNVDLLQSDHSTVTQTPPRSRLLTWSATGWLMVSRLTVSLLGGGAELVRERGWKCPRLPPAHRLLYESPNADTFRLAAPFGSNLKGWFFDPLSIKDAVSSERIYRLGGRPKKQENVTTK